MAVSEPVQAAGGVVVRAADDGREEVLVVHRPRYDDWSLPKGKLQLGEAFEDAAVREVEEETGWRCELVAALPEIHYVDRHGRPKVVRYWLMRPRAFSGFAPNDEVDVVRWLPPAEAATLLTYDADRRLVEARHTTSGPPT